jgi:hypothetical protein
VRLTCVTVAITKLFELFEHFPNAPPLPIDMEICNVEYMRENLEEGQADRQRRPLWDVNFANIELRQSAIRLWGGGCMFGWGWRFSTGCRLD